MKNLMYIVLGILLISPAALMAQEQGTTEPAGEMKMIFSRVSSSFALRAVIQCPSFGKALVKVSEELKEENMVSFEALDALGESFNALRDPANIKIGDRAKDKEYIQNVLAELDAAFAKKGRTLASIAEQVQHDHPYKVLTHAEIFAQMDGNLAQKIQKQQ